MNNQLQWLLTYLLNSIWQVPLLAAAALLAARLMAPASWRVRYLFLVAAFWLAVLLPAWSAASNSTQSGESIAIGILPDPLDAKVHSTALGLSHAPRRHSTSLPLNKPVSRAICVLYLSFLFYRAGVLLRKWRGTRKLLRLAVPAELNQELAGCWQHWQAFFNLGDVKLLVSNHVAGPVTLGFRSAALIVPPDFIVAATREELAAALCHELAHIGRHDFAVNLLIEILSLPIAFHPACWLLKQQIDESRELACDAIAARATSNFDMYARSLLSLAQSICAAPAAPFTNALGIFEANILEKRIMQLVDRKPVSSRLVRVLSAAVGVMLLASTCVGISAFTLQPATAQSASSLGQFVGTWKTTVNGQSAATVQILTYQGRLTGSVSNGDFGVDEKTNTITGWHDGTPGAAPIVEASLSGPTLAFKTLDLDGTVAWNLTLTAPGKAELRIAETLPDGTKLPAIAAERVDTSPAKDDNQSPGYTPPHLLHSVDPEYTPQARAAKFSGKCVVGLTIDTEGIPSNVHVEKPIGMGLDENAINAVKQYRFTPAMQDGQPIAKRVKIEVDFRVY